MNAECIYVSCAPVDLAWNPLSFAGARVGFGALKRSESGAGIIARVYEPYGEHGSVSISVPPEWEVRDEVNLLEEKVGGPELRFRPFEIHSWRIAK